MELDELQQAQNYRDRVSTVTETGGRKWVYALLPEGKFYNSRKILSALYIVLFFGIPFIKVNGMPFLMLNVLEGKFILFSKIFWPQDFFIFAVSMITFIVFIALFTVIYGRLFCGWACPQTIFMEMVFRKIETWIEGSPDKQRKLNAAPWDGAKIFKKTLKHVVFFALSFLIANTFLSYILGLDKVLQIISEPVTEHIVLLSGLLVFTFLFYGVFAFVREIVCTTVCPYGRLQGVLFDKDTMQVAYDYNRGETRARFSKNKPRESFGDCIDCNKCVQVCPTGIDIRNGLQMECVGCTACIDACDSMMEKVGFEKGLIRYASENEIAQKTPFKFNGRMKAYTALLVVLVTIVASLIATRKSVDTYISRIKGQLYQELPDNKLSNLYSAKIINKTNKDFPLILKLQDGSGEIQMVSSHAVTLKKETVNEVTFFVVLNKSAIRTRSTDIKIDVYAGEEKMQTVKTTFLGPFI